MIFVVVQIQQTSKKEQKTSKKVLTKWDESGIIYKLSRRAQRKAVSEAVSEVIEN